MADTPTPTPATAAAPAPTSIPPIPVLKIAPTTGQSLAATTTASAGATSAVEVYRWMLSGFPQPVPDTVVMALALVTLPIIHALTIGALAWLNKRLPGEGANT